MESFEIEQYVGSASRVVGRLTAEVLKRHAIWTDHDTALRLADLFPNGTERSVVLSQVVSDIENAVRASLERHMPR